MHREKSVPTSFVPDSGVSFFRSADKRGLTVLTYDLLQSMLWVDDELFTKNEENLRAKHLEGGP